MGSHTQSVPRTITVRFVVEFPTELLMEPLVEGRERKFVRAILTAALVEYGGKVRRVFFPHKIALEQARGVLRSMREEEAKS